MNEELEKELRDALFPLVGETLNKQIRDAIRPVVRAIAERRKNDIEVIDTTTLEDHALGRLTGTIRVREGSPSAKALGFE